MHEARKGRPLVQHHKMMHWTMRSVISKLSISKLKSKKNMLWLSELHKKIDDVTEEMQNISHDTDEREMCPWAISKCFGD
jgi:phage pi2 protein 07